MTYYSDMDPRTMDNTEHKQKMRFHAKHREESKDQKTL